MHSFLRGADVIPSRRLSAVLLPGVLFALAAPAVAVHVDIQVQSLNGKVVTGAATVTDGPVANTTEIDFAERVFGDNTRSNFVALNPGFNSLATGNIFLAPTGAQGFASGTEIGFDLLPMTIGSLRTNLSYWDGVGDVDFGPAPIDTTWAVQIQEGFVEVNYAVAGDDLVVPGGIVAEVGSSGTLHQHQPLAIRANGAVPAEGVYLVSMQLRVDGYESSDPVLIATHTFDIADSVGAAAQDWARDNYSLLVNDPGDYNGDGFVNAADYTVWRDAEAPLDGSPEQYTVWQDNYGAGQGGAPVATPEPGAGVLLAIAAVGLVAQRRRANR